MQPLPPPPPCSAPPPHTPALCTCMPAPPPHPRTCSINVHASRSVSAILILTMTTERRRLQKADVAILSHCTRLFFTGRMPMLYILSRAGRAGGREGQGQGKGKGRAGQGKGKGRAVNRGSSHADSTRCHSTPPAGMSHYLERARQRWQSVMP